MGSFHQTPRKHQLGFKCCVCTGRAISASQLVPERREQDKASFLPPAGRMLFQLLHVPVLTRCMEKYLGQPHKAFSPWLGSILPVHLPSHSSEHNRCPRTPGLSGCCYSEDEEQAAPGGHGQALWCLGKMLTLFCSWFCTSAQTAGPRVCSPRAVLGKDLGIYL